MKLEVGGFYRARNGRTVFGPMGRRLKKTRPTDFTWEGRSDAGDLMGNWNDDGRWLGPGADSPLDLVEEVKP